MRPHLAIVRRPGDQPRAAVDAHARWKSRQRITKHISYIGVRSIYVVAIHGILCRIRYRRRCNTRRVIGIRHVYRIGLDIKIAAWILHPNDYAMFAALGLGIVWDP